MALSESALSEQPDALADRDRGVELVRELAQWVAQELIEVQATQAHHEAGHLELAIPKLDKGQLLPAELQPGA